MVHLRHSTCPLLFLTAHLSTVLWMSVKGELRLIGSLQPIVAAVGDDVILPCHLEPGFDVQRLTVEWSKPDLKPDPSDPLRRVEYVHLYRDRREVRDMKIQSYARRTALFRDGLKRGNISLKITNVTLADEGRYRCLIPKLKSQMRDSIVQLIVEPNSVQTPTTETPFHPRSVQTAAPEEAEEEEEEDVPGGRSHLSALIPAVVFCVLILAAGYLLKQRRQKQNLPNYDAAPENPPAA
ncbi:myelin-oligodendrocyte glycoprotein-like [Pempheris klunzingeri]|uniref:myelin-oligodendrocyte glycoprotein-like n=1 Tax=Pempheris klunzingeri TaxID=3127111 RepID=UPI00397EE883